jgi:lysozyme
MTTPDADGTIPALFGVDVSKFQGKPDWAQVTAAGVTFALAKVSEGRTYLDPSYTYNKAAIPAAGLVPGAYHYLYWSTAYKTDADWGGQAEWFVQNADPNAIHALDVEMRAPAGQSLNVRAWVDRYRQLLPGHPLLIYTNLGLWRTVSRVAYDGAEFGLLWVAGYRPGRYVPDKGTLGEQWSHVTTSDDGGIPFLGWTSYTMMQFTDHAQVPGISGLVDGDAFPAGRAELLSLTGTTKEVIVASYVFAVGGDNLAAASIAYRFGFVLCPTPAQARAAVEAGNKVLVVGGQAVDALGFPDVPPGTSQENVYGGYYVANGTSYGDSEDRARALAGTMG